MTGMTRMLGASFMVLVAMQTEAGCRPPVTTKATAKPCGALGSSIANNLARQQWVTAVTNAYGAQFASLTSARDVNVPCLPTGTGSACSVTCTVTATPCTPTPDEKGDLLHLVAVTQKLLPAEHSPYDHLWHTIRFDAANTWQEFRDVERVAGARGDFVDVDTAVVGTKLHVFAITANGKLLHSIRGTGWQEFGDVGATLGSPNMVFRRVAAATVSGDVHVVVIDGGGQPWHTIRFANDTWQKFFGKVTDATGRLPYPDENDTFADVGATGFRTELHVALVTQNSGNLYHTMRYPNRWQPFLGNVEKVVGERGDKFRRVSVGEANGTIHLCTTTDGLYLIHTARHANQWPYKWSDIQYASKSGAGLKFVDVSCRKSETTDLHLAAVTNDGGLWHTIRRKETHEWDRFGNVEQAEAGERGTIVAVSVAGARVEK